MRAASRTPIGILIQTLGALAVTGAAIIGLGFVGKAHLEALRRLGIPVRGILGSSPERTREAVRELKIDRGYSSLDELVKDTSVSAVHVCTPNYVHHNQAKAALEAGKHVMCEKPLAINTRESQSLIGLASGQGRIGAVTYNLRYYPLCQEARELVQQGTIGEPRLVLGTYLQDWLFYANDWNWRLEPELGGRMRAIADIGTHWLDLIGWITGRRLKELCADLATVIPVRRRPKGPVETFRRSDDGQTEALRVGGFTAAYGSGAAGEMGEATERTTGGKSA